MIRSLKLYAFNVWLFASQNFTSFMHIFTVLTVINPVSIILIAKLFYLKRK